MIKQLEFEAIASMDPTAQKDIVVKNSVQIILRSGTNAEKIFNGKPVYFFADSPRDLQSFIQQLALKG